MRRLRRRRPAALCVALSAAVTIGALAHAATPRPAPRLHRAPRTHDVLGGRVAALAVADLNHDRRSDVVVGLSGTEADTAVLLARRGGRLSRAAGLFSHHDAPTVRGGLVVADFDRDRNRDIARVFLDAARDDSPRPTSIVVMFGDGHGRFPNRTIIRARCCGSDLAAGDFNGDGRRDLAVRGVGVLLGDGHGAFPVVRPGFIGGEPLSPSKSILPADFNSDGRLDLIVLNQDQLGQPATPYIEFGEGGGRFSEPHSVEAAGLARSVAIGRFNGDRRPDLAAVSDDGIGTDDLRILLGTRSGLPRLAHSRLPQARSSEVGVADMNADGKRDLVVAGDTFPGPNVVGEYRILPGNGRGFFFRQPPDPPRCCDGAHLGLGDLNRDGRPDVVTTSSRVVDGTTVQRLAVLLNARSR